MQTKDAGYLLIACTKSRLLSSLYLSSCTSDSANTHTHSAVVEKTKHRNQR